MNKPSTRHRIEKEQKDFKFVSGLPNPEDYGIIAMPNWDTTVFQIEKSNRGFTLGFGKPCSKDDGWLDLTLYTSPKTKVVIKESKVKSSEERKTKKPKQMNYV
jgi:hypothetical protein